MNIRWINPVRQSGTCPDGTVLECWGNGAMEGPAYYVTENGALHGADSRADADALLLELAAKHGDDCQLVEDRGRFSALSSRYDYQPIPSGIHQADDISAQYHILDALDDFTVEFSMVEGRPLELEARWQSQDL